MTKFKVANFWSEGINVSVKYVRNEKNNVCAKVTEYQNNFIPTMACHTLGGATEPI